MAEESIPTPGSVATKIRSVLGCGIELAEDYVKAIGTSPEIHRGMVLIRDPEGRIMLRIAESVLDLSAAPVMPASSRSWFRSIFR